MCLEGATARVEREKTLLDGVAWNVGRAVIPAFHAPRKFPGFDRFRGRKRTAAQGPQGWRAMQAAALGYHLKLGGKVRRP